MCSSVLGPAIEPSLVTWPVRKTGVDVCLANIINCAATSRTCETLPGADSIAELKTVWIESTMTKSGLSLSVSARMLCRLVSGSKNRFSASTPRRSPRILICRSDSSPEMYSTFLPLRPSLSAICMTIVDLPMPGAPPIRTSEPATMPPPRTRSSSSMPDSVRSSSCASILPYAIGVAWRYWATARVSAAAAVGRKRSSTKVFHSPQSGHCPSHLRCCEPQF